MVENRPVVVDYFVRRATTSGWEIPQRTIDNHEIVFVVEGRGIVRFESHATEVSQGDLIYFKPNQKHSMYVTEAPYLTFFAVHFTMLSAQDAMPFPQIAHLHHFYLLQQMFQMLQDVYQNKQYLYQWKQNVLLQQILCEISIAMHNEVSPTNQARVQRVIEMIHNNPCRAISQREMTEKAQIKKTLFLQIFKEITGTTPLQYAMRLKLAYARDLLLNTQKSVQEIAALCGFTDAFYFSRTFKKTFLCAPTEYRKNNQ
ncbi:MAG: AraC family transcriptional regulator [Ruthenibacterium sp.]